MRKLIVIAALIGLALLACRHNAAADSTQEGVVVSSGWASDEVAIWRDPDTGCEYLRSRYNTLTPRMTRAGQVGCDK